ncbi:MAG: hypothetical protein PVG33_04510, partial [Chloroflexota bacterium]
MKTRQLASRTAAQLLIIALLVLLVACTSTADAPAVFEPLKEQEREALSYATLMTGDDAADGPVDNAYLAPPANAQEARDVFEGTLTIPEFEMAYQDHGS